MFKIPELPRTAFTTMRSTGRTENCPCGIVGSVLLLAVIVGNTCGGSDTLVNAADLPASAASNGELAAAAQIAWIEKDPDLLTKIRDSGAKIHFDETTGTSEKVLPLLKYHPESLLCDDPAQLVKTLTQLQKKDSE